MESQLTAGHEEKGQAEAPGASGRVRIARGKRPDGFHQGVDDSVWKGSEDAQREGASRPAGTQPARTSGRYRCLLASLLKRVLLTLQLILAQRKSTGIGDLE